MLTQFRELVDGLVSTKEIDAVPLVLEWLKSVTIQHVLSVLQVQASERGQSRHYGIISMPPAIIPLKAYRGYSIEIIHWYPCETLKEREQHEDVHDHFGIIISKALIGNPYRNIEYAFVDNKLARINESEFVANQINVIYPTTIHTAEVGTTRKGLTIRVNFPCIEKLMTVYDSDSGLPVRSIRNSEIRQKREFLEIMQMLIGQSECKDQAI